MASASVTSIHTALCIGSRKEEERGRDRKVAVGVLFPRTTVKVQR